VRREAASLVEPQREEIAEIIERSSRVAKVAIEVVPRGCSAGFVVSS